MKQLSKPWAVSLVCVAGGLVCMGLRLWLFTAGLDPKGLLIPSHPGNYLSWLTAAAVAVFLILSARTRQRCRFSASGVRYAGLVCDALGFGFAAWMLLRDVSLPLTALTGGLGVLSALCSLWMLVDLRRGKGTDPLVCCPSVAFFMLFLVCRYQVWNSEPELQRCVFPLLAVILLMAAAYRRAATALNPKNSRLYIQLSRGAVFFCLASIPGSSYALCLVLWSLSLLLDGFTTLRPRAEQL